VNIDPRRPHIAYAVTSDAVSVNAEGTRANETEDGQLDLDGFEVVDMSSCMNFPPGTTIEQKRARCRPSVYRYRYPSTVMSLGHTNKRTIYGCHELEVYPDERLTCASGGALIALNMKGAFDDRGTPANFRDDKPRGTPLPCAVRDSSSAPPFTTGAKVVDCRDGTGAGTDDLAVKEWLASGAPSLAGVRWLGSAFHAGRESATGAAAPAFDSTEDIDFDHEAELTHSGRYLLSTDERGGGIVPPGASCSPGEDLEIGNGGVHAYRADRLLTRRPSSAADAFSSYARDSKGGKAIYRAPIRTRPQGALCTAHVFQQIPGQNRIFMGWYAQGTQVVDFEERADGTIDFKEAGYYIPANASQWVSHVFKIDRNSNGSFTYYGAASDFAVGDGGRNTVDVYKVTLPAPPAPRGSAFGLGRGFEPSQCLASRASIGRRGIGRLRLGRSRASVRRRPGRPLGRTSARVYRYCVKGRANRRARVIAAFDRRRKLRLVATTAKGHRVRGVRTGSRTRTVRRVFRGRLRSLGRGRLLVRTRLGGVILGTRRGRVRYVAVVDRILARRARTARAYLRLARLR
jgi:hypothetical protein